MMRNMIGQNVELSFKGISYLLKRIDEEEYLRSLVLKIENAVRDWRRRASIPTPMEQFAPETANVNPFASLLVAAAQDIRDLNDFIKNLALIKGLASTETSAGKFLDEVFSPLVGLRRVPAELKEKQGPLSIVDAFTYDPQKKVLDIYTFKSGPKTLNDDSSNSIGDYLGKYPPVWVKDLPRIWGNELNGVQELNFFYGTWTGTWKQSNKKELSAFSRAAQEAQKQGWKVEKKPEKAKKRYISHTLIVYIPTEQGGFKLTARPLYGLLLWRHLKQRVADLREFGEDILLAAFLCGAIRALVPPITDWEPKPETRKFLCCTNEIDSLSEFLVLQRSQVPWYVFSFASLVDKFICDCGETTQPKLPLTM